MTGAAATSATVDRRNSTSFGGIVPSMAMARDGSALVAALAVEHHAAGAAIPLLILSDAPGLLAWEPLAEATVHDDRDRVYTTELLHGQAGLGGLQASLWIEPPLPADSRFLRVSVPALFRLAPARGGSGITRQLPGGPWELIIDLVPPRTTAPVPAHPGALPVETGPGARVPSRTLNAFIDLIPAGQARIGPDLAVCLWAVERYGDLALLTLSFLGASDDAVPGEGVEVAAWDDRGTTYEVTPEQAGSAETWSDLVVRVAPAIDSSATRLAVRVSVHRDDADPAEFLFGIVLPSRR
jgi:hypothetical protein